MAMRRRWWCRTQIIHAGATYIYIWAHKHTHTHSKIYIDTALTRNNRNEMRYHTQTTHQNPSIYETQERASTSARTHEED